MGKAKNRTPGAAAVIASLTLVLAVFGAAPDKETVKTYQEALAAMNGAEMKSTAWKINDEWRFELVSSWEGDNPEKTMIAKLLPKKIRFNKEEETSLFAQAGHFNVLVFSKKVGEDSATMGAIDSMGLNAGKDSGLEVEQHMVIRLVFRDQKLVHSKVWPKIERGSISGGMNYRR